MALPMIFGGASPPAKYQIEHSARFRSEAGARMARTFGIPTSQNVWTLSSWMKLTANQSYYFGCSSNSYLSHNGLTTSDLALYSNGVRWNAASPELYRDFSAWYHLITTCNGENFTQYVNGILVGQGTAINAFNSEGCIHRLGSFREAGDSDCYMADVHLIDGQALSPSAFGRFDENGIWVPIRYAGTYGANGCRLEFKDASNLGLDTSGNGNHWTVNSLTAADRMLDTPTNNYCTWNPVSPVGNFTLSNGNLTAAFSSATGQKSLHGTLAVPSDSRTDGYYFEVTWSSFSQYGIGAVYVGVAAVSTSATDSPCRSIAGEPEGSSLMWAISDEGIKYNNQVGASCKGSNLSDGLISMFAVKDGKLWIGDTTNGWYANGDPSAGTHPAYSGLTGLVRPFIAQSNEIARTGTWVLNAGQSSFTGTPPDDFKALCTTNLPAVSIKKPKDHFNTLLYTGNGGTKAVTGLGFQPGLLWGKERNAVRSHFLQNEVVGPQSRLSSNGTDAEVFQPADGYVKSFDPDGFTLTAGSNSAQTVNENGGAYVAWAWKGAGAATLNNDGTLPSQVSADSKAGFSIVSFHTDGVSGRTVGHGLGAEPTFTILKAREDATTNHWYVHHRDGCPPSGGTGMALNLTIAPSASHPSLNSWSSTVLNLRTLSAGNWIAYCFAEIPGYSKFGSYMGNGSSDGPFVHCGFRPRYLLIKDIGTDGNWIIHDTARSPYSDNVGATLNTNAAYADSADHAFDDCANGFKLRGTPYGDFNHSGRTYIYAAFAEHPFGGSNVSPSPEPPPRRAS